MAPPVGNTSSRATYDVGTQSTDTQQMTTVLMGESTAAQVAARLSVSVKDLLQANPNITDPNGLTAGMDIQIPQSTSDGARDTNSPANDTITKPESMAGKRAEASLDGLAMKNILSFRTSASSGNAGTATAKQGTGLTSSTATGPQDAGDVQTSSDPRFAPFNNALQAGDGEKAAQAASNLLAQLHAEKPPQTGLINQAHMCLAAGAMLKGDFSEAQKALLAVDPKALSTADKQQFGELRDLLADAHRQAFSDAFKADTADGTAGMKDRGKAAIDHAKSLLELLQKTDSGNSAAINDTRLKLANAQLLGGKYPDAEKTLTSINEKQLGTEQKEYLGAIRQELHAQQIDALGSGYVSDMKHKRYKDAASNATAIVNDLAKYFPTARGEIASARLQQATAQIMGDDMEAARTSLGRVNRDDLKQMPKEVQDRFRELSGAVTKHFDAVKKLETLKADEAAIQDQVKKIDTLTTSGKKDLAQQAVPMAENLVATIQQKYPDNTKAIEGAKLTLANAKLEAGDRDGALKDLQALSASTTDPSIKDQVQLFQARATLQGGETDKAVKMLKDLSNSAGTPDVRKAAKSVVVNIEAGYLKNVEHKAELEQKRLEAIKVEKDPGGWWSLLNPVTAVKFISHGYDNLLDDHQRNMNDLHVVQNGAMWAADLMKRDGLTVADLQKMDVNQIAKLPSIDGEMARSIKRALRNPDVQTITKDNFQGKNFTWDKNTWYVDASYLDTEGEKISKWIGNTVRGSRSYDEELKKSDSLFDRAVGYASGAILDAVSATDSFVKDKIKTAEDFYNDPSRKDAWYSKLGRAGTFGADMLASTFTMPATLVDYKATDAERAGALTGTLLMAGTMGIIKGGGPAWESLTGGASRVGSRLASTEIAQTLAKSKFGQWAGRTAVNIGERAVKLEEKFEGTGIAKGADKIKAGLGKVEKAFEETSFAKGVDKVKAGLGTEVKIRGAKPTGGGADAGAGTLEIHPKMSNVMFDSGIKEFNMDNIMKELDRTAEGSRIADRIRSGELHVTVSREPIAPEIDGMARPASNEIYVQWGGSIEETTSTIIHEGVHTLDPTEVAGGSASREMIAREAEYEYRMKAGLKYMDPPDMAEHAYRDTFAAAKKQGLSDAQARLSAERAMGDVVRGDVHYGQGQAGTVGQSRKIGSDGNKVDGGAPATASGTAAAGAIPGVPPSRGMDKAVDELLGGKTAGDISASITQEELASVENTLIKAKRKEVTAEVTTARKSEVVAELQRQGVSPNEIQAKAKEKIEQIVNKDFPEKRLRALVKDEFSSQDIQRMALADRVYWDVYHGKYPEKIAGVTPEMQTAYEQKLADVKGRKLQDDAWEMPDQKGLVAEGGFWQTRVSKVDDKVGLNEAAKESGEGIRRFYFNLKPEKAAEFADSITQELKAQNASWEFKMPKQLKNFDRPDAGVLYVEKADYPAVKKIVTDYAKKHPEVFVDGTSAFTKSIGKGIGVAEEPLQAGLPKNASGRYSFGEFRSDVIADTILKASPGATKEEITAAVRARMESLGLDADKPWLQRRGMVDDL